MFLVLLLGPMLQEEADDDDQHGTADLEDRLGMGRQGVELGGIARVGGQHLTRDPAQQGAARDDDDREAVEQRHDQGGAEHDQRDRDDEAQYHQRRVALGGGCDGDGIVEAHHGIGDDDGADGRAQGGGRLDAVLALFLALHQLDADPQQQNAAHELQEGDGQQQVDDQDEDDSQQDRAAAADQDGRPLVPLFQIAARQRDDQRVVARQDDVHQNDLGQTAPEGGRQLKSHFSAVPVPYSPAHPVSQWRTLLSFGRRC